MTPHANADFDWKLLLVGVVGIGALLYLTRGSSVDTPAGTGAESVVGDSGMMNVITPPSQYSTSYNFPAPNMGGGSPDASFLALLASLLSGQGAGAGSGGVDTTTSKKSAILEQGDIEIIGQVPAPFTFSPAGSAGSLYDAPVKYLNLQGGMTATNDISSPEGLAALQALAAKNAISTDKKSEPTNTSDWVPAGMSGQYLFSPSKNLLVWNSNQIDPSTGMGYGVSAIDAKTGAPLSWQRDVYIYGNQGNLLYSPSSGTGNAQTVAAATSGTFTASRELTPSEYSKAYYQSVVSGNVRAAGGTPISWDSLSSSKKAEMSSMTQAQQTAMATASKATMGSTGSSGGYGGGSYVTGSASARNSAAGW